MFGEKRVDKYGYNYNLSEEELANLAVRRLKIKRGFQTHFGIYCVVNLCLVGMNIVTAFPFIWSDFWAIWPILGWGIGLGCHYVSTIMKLRITENGSAIQKEMDYLRDKLNNPNK